MNLKLKIITLLFLLLNLTGCVNSDSKLANLEFRPKPTAVEEINNIQVTYIIPKNVGSPSGTFNGLAFFQYVAGPESKIERLHTTPTSIGLSVERRTDNGVAGSGIIYAVEKKVTSQGDNTIVTFTPKAQKTYQEGVILPFPLPKLNIESYLSQATLDYKFELDSPYQVDSIKANFDRLIPTSGGYRLSVGGTECDITLEVHPYRNGTKAIIYSTIHTTKSHNNVIDLVQIIAELKKQIQQIMNA